MFLPICNNWWLLVDPADVHGTRRPVRHHHDGGHGLQDDGQARASGRDETVQAAGRVIGPLLVVSPGRHGHGRQRQQLVLPGLPVLHPQLHRLVHPRPLPGGSAQISDKFEEAQELIFVRDTMYTSLQAQADVAHTGTSDPNLIEATMEQTGVDEVTSMEKDAAKLWFTSLTSGIVVGIDKIIMLIALVVFRIGWWATIYCQQILLGMLTIFGPIQWAFSLLPKWEGAWAKCSRGI